jgi:hypothetical protein
MPEMDRSTNTAAILRLERALLWRAGGGFPARSVTWSLLCQALAAWAWCAALPLGPGVEGGSDGTPPPQATIVFVAPPTAASRPVVRWPAFPAPRSVPEPESGVWPEALPNLSGIQLQFADDVEGRLPDVLQRYHGELALLSQDDPAIALYLFDPPAWKVRETAVDVSSKLCLWMDPPERWALFRTLAQRYGVALDRYRAGALFDIGYRRCLQNAVADAAGRQRPGALAEVLGARLAFAVDRPCGVEVKEVSLGNGPVREPF